MQQVSETKEEIISRVSPLVKQVIESDSLFAELSPEEMTSLMSDLLEKHFSIAGIRAMGDDDLIGKIDSVMAGEVLYNLLSDFTPEQMAEFEAAIPKRK